MVLGLIESVSIHISPGSGPQMAEIAYQWLQMTSSEIYLGFVYNGYTVIPGYLVYKTLLRYHSKL